MRVEIIAERVRKAVRARRPVKASARVYPCRICMVAGHGRMRCKLRHLEIWTDGRAVVLACNPKVAAKIARAAWHPPLARACRGDWRPLAPAPDGRFTIAGVTAELRAWARANGRGMLAAGGKLLPGRKVPR